MRLGELTIAVDWDVKQQKQTNKQTNKQTKAHSKQNLRTNFPEYAASFKIELLFTKAHIRSCFFLSK